MTGRWTNLSGSQLMILGLILHSVGFFLAFEAMFVTLAEIIYASAGYVFYKTWEKDKFSKLTGIFLE